MKNQAPTGERSTVEHRPTWFNPMPPLRQDCVLREMLDQRAKLYPDRRLALFENGNSWTYQECRTAVRNLAAALQNLGVRKGNRVLAWLPSDQNMVLSWFAANYIGAIFVPLNTAYRGQVLQHVINSAGGEVLLAHHSLMERLAELDLPNLKNVISVGRSEISTSKIKQNKPCKSTPFQILDEAALIGSGTELDDSVSIDHWDIQTIIYTSGTTGPSKGVLSPYLQLYTTAVVNYGYMGEGEAILVNLPMFHVGGTSPIYCALVRSGSFYLVDGFSTQKFWAQVRTGNCTTTSGLIGVMAAFLGKAEPHPNDANNSLRYITMFPVNADTVAMAKRFNFNYLTGFNMTEVATPLMTDLNTTVYGSCGKARSGIECRLVDVHDIQVPQGSPGELIVRSDTPWSMNAGYDNMPEATATVWRNGWFHTGDIFRQDEDGNYFFVDRIKDTIRRRGENISSFEVENAVRQFPDVDEAIAVGVDSEISEQEIMLVVTAKTGCIIDPQVLIEFLIPRLAYFMVPRFVRIVTDIPKTETNKPRKVFFRDLGLTSDTWDRERAGLKLKREKLLEL